MTATTLDILQFLKRTLCIACATLFPFVVWYVCSDPFKVLYHYAEYYDDPRTCTHRVGLNKGMVSVKTYLNNITKGTTYNAFIFGSSISCNYKAEEWCDCINHRDSVNGIINPFHFDSSSETPMSMARKVEFLNRSGAPIDYALIVLDPIILGTDENESPFAIDPVEIDPGFLHYIKYHYTFFRASTNADFIKNLIAAKVSGKADNIGHNPIFEKQPIVHDTYTNEESLPLWDSLISVNPRQFYLDNPLISPRGAVVSGPSVITRNKRSAFNRIAEIFNDKNTDYQIIISPNRRGISLSPEDLCILQNIFQPSRVHDFSSVYANDLQIDTLLYDTTHYRPQFASKIMRAVYAPEQ